eukprot:COSAG01_NODE_56651_length_317_cov_0.513761_1_plen_46_part_01
MSRAPCSYPESASSSGREYAVRRREFKNLGWLVVITALCKALPLLL